MKKLYLVITFYCLQLTYVATAQNTNSLAILLEKAVIEYYDTLSNSSTYCNYRQQMYRRGELYDTNIYLGINKGYCIIDIISFISNLQTPNRMPPKAFFSYGKNYLFIERTSSQSNFLWRECHPPKLDRKSVEMIVISDVGLYSDTLTIRLTTRYLSSKKEKRFNNYNSKYFLEISHGVIFKYLFSSILQDWICVEKYFWGI